MAWSKEQAKEMAPKGQKARADKLRAAKEGRKRQQTILDKMLADQPADCSPETALELRIAKLVRAGRTRTVDRLTQCLARLRKAGASRRRQVESAISSHNIDYLQYNPGSHVAPQRLTTSQSGVMPATPTYGSAGEIKESPFAGSPQGHEGGGVPGGPPPGPVNPISTPTYSIPAVPQASVITSQPVTQETVKQQGAEAPYTPPKPPVGPEGVPSPGPGWKKVKVGGHWVWGQPVEIGRRS